jgi:hypothetical protein
MSEITQEDIQEGFEARKSRMNQLVFVETDGDDKLFTRRVGQVIGFRKVPEEIRRTKSVDEWVQDVLEVVAETTNTTPDELVGHSKVQHLVDARHIAMHVIKTGAELSYPVTAKYLGDRDHTTVRSGKVKIDEVLSADVADSRQAKIIAWKDEIEARIGQAQKTPEGLMLVTTQDSSAALVTVTMDGLHTYSGTRIAEADAGALQVAPGTWVHDMDGRNGDDSVLAQYGAMALDLMQTL